LRIFSTIFGLLLLAVAVIFGGGSLLPREHHVAIKARFNQSAEELWRLVSDFEHAPQWNTHLQSAKRLPDRNGNEVWEENYDGKVFIFETTENTPPRRISRKILNDDLPYGGTWTFEVVPDGNGAILVITDEGFIDNPGLRFMAKFFMGQGATIAGYMQAFGRKYKEALKIEVVTPTRA